MLRAINLCQDVTLNGSTKIKLPFLPLNELDLCNDYILRDPEYNDRLCINLHCHCIYLDTDLLINVLLTKVVLRPTKN